MSKIALAGFLLVVFALQLTNTFHVQFKKPNFFAKLFKKIIQPHNSCKCGITNRTGRFIGGSELTPHEFPWMALIMSIGIKPEKHQTGTLINDRYILTSATQLFGHTPHMYKVALGIHLMCQNEFTSTIYSVQEIIIHPAFYNTTSLNNIALLKISVPVLFSHHITPICLPSPESTYNGEVGTVASWFSAPSLPISTDTSSTTFVPNYSRNGATTKSITNFDVLCIPRKMGLPIQIGGECKFLARFNEGCIGVSGVANYHLCQGDTGSGIFVQNYKGYYELAGILSNKQWCSGEGSIWMSGETTKTTPTTTRITSESTETMTTEQQIDENEEDQIRIARGFDTLNHLFGFPIFIKVSDELEWILMNTRDALYCHKI